MNRPPLFVALLATGLASATPALAAKPDAAPAAVTTEEVGDAGSFGRNLKWLGLASAFLQLSDTCTPAPGDPPLENCIVLNPAPAATSFNFPDLDRVTLPARSSNSLICHWQTPIVSYSVSNPTGGQASYSLRVTAVYRIENEVLNEPGLVDPGTGLPLAGAIELPLTSIFESGSMDPGEFESEFITGTRMCIGGLVTRDSLVANYGLSEAQARRFFNRQTTIRLGLSGQARLVENASLNIGSRFVGD
jgi:hypothetical protein